MDTPIKLASGEERSYVRTAWKSVMATRIASLFVAIWPGMIQAWTYVCCVDNQDIPLYNVEVYNTCSNPLQHLIACFPTSTDPSIRKMGFGPGETQAALGNFIDLRAYFVSLGCSRLSRYLCKMTNSPGIPRCLWKISQSIVGCLWKCQKSPGISGCLWKCHRHLWVSLEVSQASLGIFGSVTGVFWGLWIFEILWKSM